MMMDFIRVLKRIAVYGSGVVFFVMAQSHAAVIINYDIGTGHSTSEISGFSTYGDDMDGMSVTAFFSDSSSQTLSWADTGSNSGGVTGIGWSLSLSGNSWNSNWVLNNNSSLGVIGLILNGATGDTMFDIAWSPFPGSIGSSAGREFSVSSVPAYLDITATYTDIVSIGSADPVGDLYASLLLDFTNIGGLHSGDGLTWLADTDNSVLEGDVVVTAVPEPSILVLLSVGLFSLGFAYRRGKI